jgi:predicted DNA-binding transcriptional regulator AlpA
MANAVLRFPQVIALTGLARSTIYAKLADDNENFPRPIRLGARSVVRRQANGTDLA